MSNGTTVAEKKPTYCKWCGRVEITFSDAFKSKSGKYIPIEKSSGVPHKCTANPNNQPQQQQPSQQPAEQQQSDDDVPKFAPSLNLAEMIRILQGLTDKIDYLTRLVYLQTTLLQQKTQQQEQEQDHNNPHTLIDNR